MSNTFTKPKMNSPMLNLPTPKVVSTKLRTLGTMKMPTPKGPASRGGCCGR
jgi:hypothetical protein